MKLAALVVLLVCLGSVAACGGDSSRSPSSPSPSPAPAVSATANVGGNYTWTVRNSPSCPSFVRTSNVVITQSGSTLAVATQTWVQHVPFSGAVTGNAVALPPFAGMAVGLSEGSITSATGFFAGRMTGTFSGRVISGTMSGQLGTTFQSACNAADHTFSFNPR